MQVSVRWDYTIHTHAHTMQSLSLTCIHALTSCFQGRHLCFSWSPRSEPQFDRWVLLWTEVHWQSSVCPSELWGSNTEMQKNGSSASVTILSLPYLGSYSSVHCHGYAPWEISDRQVWLHIFFCLVTVGCDSHVCLANKVWHRESKDSVKALNPISTFRKCIHISSAYISLALCSNIPCVESQMTTWLFPISSLPLTSCFTGEWNSLGGLCCWQIPMPAPQPR